jgi:hypothetical protein
MVRKAIIACCLLAQATGPSLCLACPTSPGVEQSVLRLITALSDAGVLAEHRVRVAWSLEERICKLSP